MKLLHLADLHLGAEMNARLTPDKAERRKQELCEAFERAIDYAKSIGVSAVLLAGDVFDTAYPQKWVKERFFEVVRSSPQISFYYLRGNHDDARESNVLPNLFTFTDGWTTYSLGEGVTISGIELTDGNSLTYYDGLRLNERDKNIVLLHGQVADGKGKEKIHLRSLENKHIDYLALGHIHSFSTGRLGFRGCYAYAGCLEPRGFDEVGEKGFVVIDTDDFCPQFIVNEARSVRLVTVDVSGTKGFSEVLARASAAVTLEEKDMPRIQLVGEVDFQTNGLEDYVHRALEGKYFALSVKDETVPALHLEKYADEVSLEAEFVRTVLADETLTEREKRRVIEIGLNALSGEKL